MKRLNESWAFFCGRNVVRILILSMVYLWFDFGEWCCTIAHY